MITILGNQLKKLHVIALSLVVFVHVSVFATRARPIQDDYSLLADISEKGFIGYLTLVWQSHGGNLTPMVLNAAAISSALNSFNFFSLAAFSLLTFLLVGTGAWILTTQIRFGELGLPSAVSLFLIFGTLFGFEGVLSPGLIGAYYFSSASAVHLWPMIFAVLGIHFASKSSTNLFLVFLLGFFAGNSNIAESLAIVTATFLLLIFPKRFSREYSSLSLRLFMSGLLLGAITIIASPGFWIRATENTEDRIPNSVSEFFIRFLKAVSVFAVDILTHPALYVFLVFGYLFQKTYGTSTASALKWNILEVVFFTLLFSLILGATFAYPAWHQSLGLLFLLPCASFIFGYRFGARAKFFKLNLSAKIASIFLILLMLVVMRADFLVWQSGGQWRESNTVNVCALKGNSAAILSNPEIHYPLFNLGVEDVQTWPWIRASYVRWISNVEPANLPGC